MKTPDVTKQSAELVVDVKRRALLFCVDNPQFGNHLPAIEAAMFIGASIALEHDESDIQLQAWQESFGTNQLAEAIHRLKVAEELAHL